jgi:putative acetyltransferase
MPRGAEVGEPASAPDWAAARALVREYASALEVGRCIEDLAGELERLPDEYGPPGGAFLLARLDGHPVGCVALRPFDASRGEVKRLYVAAPARGRGVGRTLLAGIIARGRVRGYQQLVLDTLDTMLAAQALYRSLGFRSTAPYRLNPLPGAPCFALDLSARALDEVLRQCAADAASRNE